MPLSDNDALNAIVDELGLIEEVVSDDYTDLVSTGITALANADILSRIATPKAVKTTVINQGPCSVLVKEESVPVLIVPPMESKSLPMPGIGVINVSIIADAQAAANVAISTYVNSNLS